MTILFAGGENSEVGILSGSMITTAGKFRATYARGAINSTNENGVIHDFSGALLAYIVAQGTVVDFWYGFQYVGSGGAVLGSTCCTFSNAGVGFMRIGNPAGTATGTCQMATSPDGTTWTQYSASNITQPSTPTEWTFRILRHASTGKFQWYVGGSLWYEFTGNTAALFSTVTRCQWGNAGSNNATGISEIVATSSDDTRVGMNCATLYYTGDGHDVDWTNGYADVAELSEDTSTVKTTTTAAKDSSFLHVNVPTLTPGIIVRAVIVSGKWRTGGTAPPNLYGYLRISGTNYANAPTPAAIQSVQAVAYLLQYIWHLSPATGLAFTESEVNALEPGMRSAA